MQSFGGHTLYNLQNHVCWGDRDSIYKIILSHAYLVRTCDLSVGGELRLAVKGDSINQRVTLWLICPGQNRWDEHGPIMSHHRACTMGPNGMLRDSFTLHGLHVRPVMFFTPDRKARGVWLTSQTRKTLYIHMMIYVCIISYYITHCIYGLSYFCSMYGIFSNICPINDPNVGQYTIHPANEYLKSLTKIPRLHLPSASVAMS